LLRRAHAYLGTGPAALVLVNLEDLFLETSPQNLPGTASDQGNWCRRVAGSAADARMAVRDLAAIFRKG
jgi:4-alpha-glucanotransferase